MNNDVSYLTLRGLTVTWYKTTLPGDEEKHWEKKMKKLHY